MNRMRKTRSVLLPTGCTRILSAGKLQDSSWHLFNGGTSQTLGSGARFPFGWPSKERSAHTHRCASSGWLGVKPICCVVQTTY